MFFETGANSPFSTTIIPLDDTIPQITEGDQYMTLAIPPQSGDQQADHRGDGDYIDICDYRIDNGSSVSG